MGSFQCPGDGCGNEVSRQPTRDETARHWVGTTCRDCEQRALEGLSERHLAQLTRDPYLRPAAVRALFERRSDTINAALVQRGGRYLQPSIAESLGVVDDEPAVALVPFWPRYRSFDGDREGATVAAGPELWAGLERDDRDAVAPVADAEPAEPPLDVAPAVAATVDEPVAEPDDLAAPADAVSSTVTDVILVADEATPGDDSTSTVDGTISASSTSRRRRRRPLMALAALVVLAGAGLVWALAQGGDDDEGELGRGAAATASDGGATTVSPTVESSGATVATPPTTAPRAAAPILTSSVSAPAGTASEESSPPSVESASTTEDATTTPVTEPSVVPSTTAAGAVVEAQRWADLVDGTVYLRGTVPDDATADRIRQIVVDAAGADDVVAEQEIALGSPSAEDAPLIVRKADLFDAGSTTPTEAVAGLVELGLELLEQHPDATIEVGGHTDDVGEEPANLELSRARAQSVYDALVDAGADPDRLTVQAYGETAPVVVNGTEAGRAANRRIELSVSGLFP